MAVLSLTIRADVLAAVRRELLGDEKLDSVIEDLAYREARARAGDPAPEYPPMGCVMSGPLVAVTVSIPHGPLRLLRDALRPTETLDGVVTALLIGEVRYRRTSLMPYVVSADEEVMPEHLAVLARLIHA